MLPALLLFASSVAWVGHACVCTAVLNNLYGRPFPKPVLRPIRLLTGLAILGFPFLMWSAVNPAWFDAAGRTVFVNGIWGQVVLGYAAGCLFLGGGVFPLITVSRYTRRPPLAVLAEHTETLDLWAELGPAAIGDGKGRLVTRLPGNCVFAVDFTELTLAVPGLPPAWEGLTVLLVSDVHFHGTPSRLFFDRVMQEIGRRWPATDIVCLAGDYVDTDTHHEWIGPLLGSLRATEGRFAVLGNHDHHHEPDRVRAELAAAGYAVLGNGWREATIRGERCVVIGHEGPWFAPPPDLSDAPADGFRLCISHTPDNFYWGQRHHAGLMLCGHVHGGQVRVPVIGSIFVPSVYGRRFDMGVFEGGGTVMVVGRGLSGKEPLRFRCHPQVLRLTLRPGRYRGFSQ